jgi:hypothetical protein
MDNYGTEFAKRVKVAETNVEKLCMGGIYEFNKKRAS